MNDATTETFAPTGAAARHRRRFVTFGEGLTAALWGFAEATFFFVVPDVVVSFIAVRRGAVVGAWAAVMAAIGALLGGVLMYSWGAGVAVKVITPFLDVIPAISRDMIAQAQNGLSEKGAVYLLTTGFIGMPYKASAALAAHAGVGFGAFVLASLLARLGRFLVSALLAAGAAALWRKALPAISPLWPWAVVWGLCHLLVVWWMPA